MARILVIDDEAGIRETVGSMLEMEGYEVDLAEDGNDAISHFQTKEADLIIVDIMMPQKGGLETIMELKRKKPDLKVIAISGVDRVGPRKILDWAQKLGADKTFGKPFSLTEVKDAVRSLIPS